MKDIKTLEQLKKDVLERPPFSSDKYKDSYRTKNIQESFDAAINERDQLRKAARQAVCN